MQNKEAIDDYSMVIEVDPLNAHAYHNRGILYDKLGMIDQALSDFTKVFELDSKQFGNSLSPEERAAVLSSLGKQQPQPLQQSQSQYSQPNTLQSQQIIQPNQPSNLQSNYQQSNYQAPAAKILQPKQIQSSSSDQYPSAYSPVMSNTLPNQPPATNVLPPPVVRVSLPPQNTSPPQNNPTSNTPGIRTTSIQSNNSMTTNNNINIPLYNGSMNSGQNLAPPPVIRPAITRPSSLPPQNPTNTNLNASNPAAIAASTAANTQYNATIGGVKVVLPSSSSSTYQSSNTNDDKGSKTISSLDDKLDNMSKMLQSFGTNTSNSNYSAENSNPLARIKPPLSGMMQRRLSQQQSQQASQP